MSDALAGLYDLHALKTVTYYQRALNRAVLDFYRGDIEGTEFVDVMLDLIEGQFRRAWNEGMRNVGLDPKQDMTDEFEFRLLELVEAEKEHILDFAGAVEQARIEGGDVKPLQARVDLWANRYNEVVNEAEIFTKPEQRFVWELGATEEHCSTCFGLNGTVATGSDWSASGYHPQGAPNPKLECGGWRCDCRLSPTDEPATPGGIPNV